MAKKKYTSVRTGERPIGKTDKQVRRIGKMIERKKRGPKKK